MPAGLRRFLFHVKKKENSNNHKSMWEAEEKSTSGKMRGRNRVRRSRSIEKLKESHSIFTSLQTCTTTSQVTSFTSDTNINQHAHTLTTQCQHHLVRELTERAWGQHQDQSHWWKSWDSLWPLQRDPQGPSKGAICEWSSGLMSHTKIENKEKCKRERKSDNMHKHKESGEKRQCVKGYSFPSGKVIINCKRKLNGVGVHSKHN